MKNKITRAKKEIIDYLQSQKEPEHTNRYYVEEEYWRTWNEAMETAIQEVKDVFSRIENDDDFKKMGEYKHLY